MLISVLRDVDAVVQLVKAKIADGDGAALTPAVMGAFGEWSDRLTRTAKVVLDGDVQAKLASRLQRAREHQAAELAAIHMHAVDSSELTATQRAELGSNFVEGVRLMAEHQLPPVPMPAFVKWVNEARAEASNEETDGDHGVTTNALTRGDGARI